MERTELLTLQVSTEEKDYVIECARKACLPISDYLILLALSEPHFWLKSYDEIRYTEHT